MDPVEEFARLKEAIRLLEDRAAVLREAFLKPGARLRSNGHEIVVRTQTRRVFQKDRLPPQVLQDPAYWAETSATLVTVREIGADRPRRAPPVFAGEELVVIEPFDLPPPARPLPSALAGTARR
jgi:hypothetical protein